MALITLSHRHLVGIGTIDDGHAAIVGMLNDLHAAMLKGRAEEVVGVILGRLLDYAHRYLPIEESLLQASGYPQLARHCARHGELTSGIEEYVQRHKRCDKDAIVHLARFLRDWISIHVRQEDKESGWWLQKHAGR